MTKPDDAATVADGSKARPYRLMSSDEIEKVMEAQNRLKRDLVMLPRGGKDWRKAYARYRRTEHWKRTSAAFLKIHPFCSMCPRKATQVHHRMYAFFMENTNDLRAVCARCHKAHHGK